MYTFHSFCYSNSFLVPKLLEATNLLLSLFMQDEDLFILLCYQIVDTFLLKRYFISVSHCHRHSFINIHLLGGAESEASSTITAKKSRDSGFSDGRQIPTPHFGCLYASTPLTTLLTSSSSSTRTTNIIVMCPLQSRLFGRHSKRESYEVYRPR